MAGLCLLTGSEMDARLADCLYAGLDEQTNGQVWQLQRRDADATVKFVLWYDDVAKSDSSMMLERSPGGFSEGVALTKPHRTMAVTKGLDALDPDAVEAIADTISQAYGEPDGILYRVTSAGPGTGENAEPYNEGVFGDRNWCQMELVLRAPSVPANACPWLQVLMDTMEIPTWWSLLVRLVCGSLQSMSLRVAGKPMPVPVSFESGAFRIGAKGSRYDTYSSCVKRLQSLQFDALTLSDGTAWRTYHGPIAPLHVGSRRIMPRWDPEILVAEYVRPMQTLTSGTSSAEDLGDQGVWVVHDGAWYPFRYRVGHDDTSLLSLDSSSCAEEGTFSGCVYLAFSRSGAAELSILSADGGCQRYGKRGGEFLDMAIALCKAVGATEIGLTDASAVSCGGDRMATRGLALLSVFKSGRSFYESRGFRPSKGAETYDEAAAFLHECPSADAVAHLEPLLDSRYDGFWQRISEEILAVENATDYRVQAVLERAAELAENRAERSLLIKRSIPVFRRNPTLGQAMTQLAGLDCETYEAASSALALSWPEFRDARQTIKFTNELVLELDAVQ